MLRPNRREVVIRPKGNLHIYFRIPLIKNKRRKLLSLLMRISKGDFFMRKIKKIILAALLLALLIILARFVSVKTQLLVISFSFIPIMMSAIWLGPKYSTLIAGLGDLIGAILFPFGTYFPGFTLSAALSGLIYGLFLHQKFGKEESNLKFIIKLIVSNVLVLGLVHIFLNALWLNIMYQKAFWIVVGSRIVTQLIMLPIQVVTIFILKKVTDKYLKKYLID